jgi:FMN phosphatase YigB (HAD superfamily)
VRAYSTEIGARKPNAQLFQAALDELGIPAGQVIYVGDDPRLDVAAARRIGMRTILKVPPGSVNGKRPSTLADHVIERIGQILDRFDIVPTNGEADAATPSRASSLPTDHAIAK